MASYRSSPQQVIDELREFDWRAKISERRAEKTPDLTKLVRSAVAGNTFRGLRDLDVKPSLIFRSWAIEIFSGNAQAEVVAIRDRPGYDEWLARLAARLERRWRREAGVQIRCGPKYKLLDLLLKTLCESPFIPEPALASLVSMIHVPLDKYVLLKLSPCVAHFPGGAKIPAIPKNPSMNFIKNHDAYTTIQQGIRELADEAGVPPIALDYLAWRNGSG